MKGNLQYDVQIPFFNKTQCDENTQILYHSDDARHAFCSHFL